MGERHSRAGHQDGVNVPARPGRASYGPLAPGPAGRDVGGGWATIRIETRRRQAKEPAGQTRHIMLLRTPAGAARAPNIRQSAPLGAV